MDKQMLDATKDAKCPVHAEADHPKLPAPRVGILLANLGTPDNYDYWSMRRYLNEFLSDKRVIDYSALDLAAIVAVGHSDQTPLFIRRRIQINLERGRRRKPFDDDHQSTDHKDQRIHASPLRRSGGG